MPSLFLTDAAVRRLPIPASGQIDHWDTQVKGFGLRISSGGSRTFVLNRDKRRITIGTYNPNLPTHMSLADAREAAIKLKFTAKPAARISFDDARTAFCARHLDTLKPTTALEQKNVMRRFHFSKPLASITMQDVMRVLDAMPRGSARSCFNVLRTFFNWAVANDYLKHSPLKKSPYKPRFRDRLLTDDEIRAIWKETYNHGTFGTIVRCLILSGQRLTQIGSYDPSWSAETIVFPAWVMKSNKQHTIPLTPLLEAELGQHSQMTSFSRTMEKFRKALPDIPHFVLHDIRRFFSSTHARIGTPLHITERLMDHTTGSETPISRVYNRYNFATEMRSAQLNYEAHITKITGST